MKSSPPSRIRQVRVPLMLKVLAEVGLARQRCFLSVTAVLDGGKVKSRLLWIPASPALEIRLSKADMVS